MQRWFAHRGLEPDLKVGTGETVLTHQHFNENILNDLPMEFNYEAFVANWLEFKGVHYKCGLILVLEHSVDGVLFAEITNILVGKSKLPYFLINPLSTVGYDSHFHSHEIKYDASIDKDVFGYNINDLAYPFPEVARTINNNKTYVTLKHAL